MQNAKWQLRDGSLMKLSRNCHFGVVECGCLEHRGRFSVFHQRFRNGERVRNTENRPLCFRTGSGNRKGETQMEILRVEHLSKHYGAGENLVKAVDDVSFSVEKGEFLAIIGPSGSGKSTLLHILGGVDRPTSGKVWVDGQDVYAQDDEALAIFRRRQVGLIYQFYNLIPVLTAEENMTLPVLLDGRKVNRERLEELLDTLALQNRRKALPNQLSGGQQQRVSIGRALMNAPAVVLADEPTGNLDSKNSQEIVQLLKYSNRHYGQTLIVITHDESIALQADRILAIEDGRIVRDERVRS